MKRTKRISMSEEDMDLYNELYGGYKEVNISSLITKLEKIREEHGNIPLCVGNHDYLSAIGINELKLDILKADNYNLNWGLISPSYLSITIDKGL